MSLTGRVIEEQKNYLIVDTPAGPMRTSTRGLLKKERKRICVGDLVECEPTNLDTGEGIILSVHERSSLLIRPPLANLDQMVCLSTLKSPPLDLEALDRFLFCAAAFGLAPLMVFNKTDLLDDDGLARQQAVVETYRRIGFPVVLTSAKTGDGVAELVNACTGKTSAFTGLSGVGKSALLQRIFPERQFRVGEVSGSTGRGTHTTTSVTLLALSGGGYIADTPGLSFVDVPSIPPDSVASFFPELEARVGRCRFNNCLHDNEPGCVVKPLAEAGEIAPWRLEHFHKICRDMEERNRGEAIGKGRRGDARRLSNREKKKIDEEDDY